MRAAGAPAAGAPWLLLGGLGVLLMAAASLFIGRIPLGPADLWRDPAAGELLLVSRIPRTAAALLAGAALAVSGQIMQILARSRFVEPMTAGAGQSAALGILLAAMVFPAAPLWVKMGIASLAALAGALGLMALLRPLPPTQPLLAPLTALVYGGAIGAATAFVAFQADMMQFVDTWLTGELSGVLEGRYELLWLAGGATVAAWFAADRLTLLGLGETTARGLGLNVARARALGLGATALVTAVTVTTVGAIPFIGLVAPNLVSRWMGDDLRRALPVTALLGAGLVLGADILGRVIRAPYEVPVAVLAGVLGGALFLAVLLRGPTRG
ncbi:iron chelate uptake ABC transporter family permease subunit [Rhodovulum sp. DZ06]|uniref:iron chelate uptake ABC transporter family permease subunit n=1 Tax=Rhodovulum sp. DZ06 TaxID=3425126 RepID=UPI003D33238D